jgi:hypothetical protein
MKTFKLTSSVKKLPDSTVEFWLLKLLGLTLTLIFLSFVSPGVHTKNRGIGNLSAIIYYASSMGTSRSDFKLA